MSGLDKKVYEAQRAVERRMAAAAGVTAPSSHEEEAVEIASPDLRAAQAMFAGTGIPALDTLRVIHYALDQLGVNAGSLAVFWLGYELGATR